jgi:hypothetical protein
MYFMVNKLLCLLALTLFQTDAGVAAVSKFYFQLNSAAIRAAFWVSQSTSEILISRSPFRGGVNTKREITQAYFSYPAPILFGRSIDYLPDTGLLNVSGIDLERYAINIHIRSTHKPWSFLGIIFNSPEFHNLDFEIAYCEYSTRCETSLYWCKYKKAGERIFLAGITPRVSGKHTALTGIT